VATLFAIGYECSEITGMLVLVLAQYVATSIQHAGGYPGSPADREEGPA
jgi:hypothetical protein